MNVILKVDPYPKARPRLTKSGQAYTPKGTKKNERLIKYELIRNCERTMYECPLTVQLNFFIKRPKSVSKKRIYPSVRPDLDNLIKQFCDAANGYLWKDDSVICELIARKHYTTGDGYIHLIVDELE